MDALEKRQQPPDISMLKEGLSECKQDLQSVQGSRERLEKLEQQVGGLEEEVMKCKEMLKTLSAQRLKRSDSGVAEGRKENTGLMVLTSAQVCMFLYT